MNDDHRDIALSIIVLVFNGEKYLAKCIDSILSQMTIHTFELIVVDDGSTDGSAILRRYCRNPRLVVVSPKNGGVSAARNEGIRHAKGKYLMFVNADEYLYEDSVETLLDRAVKDDADIVQGSYCIVDVEDNLRGHAYLQAGRGGTGRSRQA